jgi:sporulation-control protein spo0M
MSELIGKWQQPEGEAYPGLYFEFRPDGTYRAVFEEMGITSSGTYTAANGLIDIDQTQHTMGLMGKFEGRYEIKGDTLIMALNDPTQPRPESLEHRNKRRYIKQT